VTNLSKCFGQGYIILVNYVKFSTWRFAGAVADLVAYIKFKKFCTLQQLPCRHSALGSAALVGYLFLAD
jgi:hypothetical protein